MGYDYSKFLKEGRPFHEFFSEIFHANTRLCGIEKKIDLFGNIILNFIRDDCNLIISEIEFEMLGCIKNVKMFIVPFYVYNYMIIKEPDSYIPLTYDYYCSKCLYKIPSKGTDYEIVASYKDSARVDLDIESTFIRNQKVKGFYSFSPIEPSFKYRLNENYNENFKDINKCIDLFKYKYSDLFFYKEEKDLRNKMNYVQRPVTEFRFCTLNEIFCYPSPLLNLDGKRYKKENSRYKEIN